MPGHEHRGYSDCTAADGSASVLMQEQDRPGITLFVQRIPP